MQYYNLLCPFFFNNSFLRFDIHLSSSTVSFLICSVDNFLFFEPKKTKHADNQHVVFIRVPFFFNDCFIGL